MDIDIPARPTQEQVEAEYEAFWQALNGRPIESLIDLPLMNDPELLAAMRVFSVFFVPAFFIDWRLYCFQVCRMVRISVERGTNDDSAAGYAFWGTVFCSDLHRPGDGYRFAKLGCDLTEKHGFIASKGKCYLALGTIAAWTQPIAAAIDFVRTGIRAANDTGDPTFACIGMCVLIANLLLRNDPLDVVWRETEVALDFARKAKFADAVDHAVSQQRFIAAMQGLTAGFSTFSDAQFDEARFETQLTGARMPFMMGSYWILKLKARFLSGHYTEALAAADKAKALLPTVATHLILLDYFCYAALTVAAL